MSAGETSSSLRDELKRRALELGFSRFGVARAEALTPEGERLREWITEGRHASLEWMADTVDVRIDPRHDGMVPGAQSVVVLATAFGSGQAALKVSGARVARYAWGRDYHNVISKRLRKLESFLRDAGHAVRHSVDSRPVFERAWAVRAGVGFVGKNCCLIVPGLGSHVFLSTLVTTASLPVDEPIREGCGDCRACLDVCPTRAFVKPRVLDSRRCVSLLTIESDEIPHALRSGVEDWLFGCDACQDVCPYNRGRGATGEPNPAFAPAERFEGASLRALFEMDEPTFKSWSEGSPLRRAGRSRILRNAAIVLGNQGGTDALPLLRRVASDPDESPSVREAAQWAITAMAARGIGSPDGSAASRARDEV